MRYAVTIPVLLLLSVTGTTWGDETSPLDQALDAFEAGRYEEVVKLTAKVPKEAPEYPRARYLAGEAHLLRSDPQEAAKAFREVLAVRPKAIPAQVGLGRALTASGELEEAETLLSAAVKADARDAAARRALGELQIAQGKLGKARQTLRAALKLAPKDPLCVRALVEVLLRGGDQKGAASVAKKFVKDVPEHPIGHFLEGLILERRKKINAAVEAYERALNHDEGFLDAHKNLAILYHTNNPRYEDKASLRKALHHYEAYFEGGGRDRELMKTWRQLQRFAALELEDEEEDKGDDDE